MPSVSSFILPSSTQDFRQQQHFWVQCSPWFIMWRATDSFYLCISSMTLLLWLKNTQWLLNVKSSRKFLIWLHSSGQTFFHSFWTLKFYSNQAYWFLFTVYVYFNFTTKISPSLPNIVHPPTPSSSAPSSNKDFLQVSTSPLLNFNSLSGEYIS